MAAGLAEPRCASERGLAMGGGCLAEPRCASERGLAMGGGCPAERRFTEGSSKSVARFHRSVLAYWKFESISLQRRVSCNLTPAIGQPKAMFARQTGHNRSRRGRRNRGATRGPFSVLRRQPTAAVHGKRMEQPTSLRQSQPDPRSARHSHRIGSEARAADLCGATLAWGCERSDSRPRRHSRRRGATPVG